MTRKKILVVDDSKTARMMSEMILKKFPFDVLTAQDGEEGLKKALAEFPDLILLDVVMPRKNGLDTLKEIRSREDIKDIPVIMITTRAEAESVEAGFEIGCNDYVIKPFRSNELVQKIENLISA